jgi:hypothetical protein
MSFETHSLQEPGRRLARFRESADGDIARVDRRPLIWDLDSWSEKDQVSRARQGGVWHYDCLGSSGIGSETVGEFLTSRVVVAHEVVRLDLEPGIALDRFEIDLDSVDEIHPKDPEIEANIGAIFGLAKVVVAQVLGPGP